MNSKIRFQVIILSIGFLLFLIKILAWYLTQSVAIFTDALEGIVNLISGLLGFYSLYLSSQPRDKNHPYGHGKVEFISSGVEGAFLFSTGLIIVYESIHRFFHANPLQNLDMGLWLVLFAGIVNLIMGWLSKRKGIKEGSPVLTSSGIHLMADFYTSIGLVLGLLVIYLTEIYWLDSIVALVFASIILYQGLTILRKSIAGIMDEADMNLLKEVIESVDKYRKDNWIDLHNLRIIKYGGILHLDGHLTLPWYFNVRDAHKEVALFEDLIKKNYGKNVELFIHSDPCKPESCSICIKKDCNVREAPFEKKLKWDLSRVLENLQHKLGE